MKAIKLPCGKPAPKQDPGTEQRLEQLHQRLCTYLESQKLKYSEQRWKIAKYVLESRGHYNAQAIVKEVTQKHPEIGPATVYRNLELLCDAKVIRETLVDAKGNAVYEGYDEEHHDHIVCLDCNQIFEFHDKEIEKLQEKVAKKMAFKQVRHRHIIYAKCEKL